MKNRFLTYFLIAIFALGTFNCTGSKASSTSSFRGSGLYLTPADYISGKLSLEVDCKNEKHKIRLHDFFNKPYIDIIHEGKNYRYQRSEIYGIRDCEGKDYRFVDNEEFAILESKAITLYGRSVLKSNPSGKGAITVEENYFSLRPDSEILPLTIHNVKKAFPENHSFHDQMDMIFKYDEDLTHYDSFHNIYKVNRLLDENRK